VKRSARILKSLGLPLALYNLTDALNIARALESFKVAGLEDALPPESVADGFRSCAKAMDGFRSVPRESCIFARVQAVVGAVAVNNYLAGLSKGRGDCWKGQRIADLELGFMRFRSPHNISSPLGTIASCHVVPP